MTAHAQTRAPAIGGTRGPGLAIAERLATRGCRRIALAGRNRAGGRAAAAALAAQGLDAVFLPADAADAGATDALAGIRAAAVDILSMVMRCGQSVLGPCAASKAPLAKVAMNAARGRGDGDGRLAAAGARQRFGQPVGPAGVAGLAACMLSPAAGVMTGALADFDRNVTGACPE